jgi:hypothetical protein
MRIFQIVIFVSGRGRTANAGGGKPSRDFPVTIVIHRNYVILSGISRAARPPLLPESAGGNRTTNGFPGNRTVDVQTGWMVRKDTPVCGAIPALT